MPENTAEQKQEKLIAESEADVNLAEAEHAVHEAEAVAAAAEGEKGEVELESKKLGLMTMEQEGARKETEALINAHQDTHAKTMAWASAKQRVVAASKNRIEAEKAKKEANARPANTPEEAAVKERVVTLAEQKVTEAALAVAKSEAEAADADAERANAEVKAAEMELEHEQKTVASLPSGPDQEALKNVMSQKQAVVKSKKSWQVTKQNLRKVAEKKEKAAESNVNAHQLPGGSKRDAAVKAAAKAVEEAQSEDDQAYAAATEAENRITDAKEEMSHQMEEALADHEEESTPVTTGRSDGVKTDVVRNRGKGWKQTHDFFQKKERERRAAMLAALHSP